MTDNRETAGTPRWVKVFGIVTLILVVAVVVVVVIGGGHGPSRHGAGDATAWGAVG